MTENIVDHCRHGDIVEGCLLQLSGLNTVTSPQISRTEPRNHASNGLPVREGFSFSLYWMLLPLTLEHSWWTSCIAVATCMIPASGEPEGGWILNVSCSRSVTFPQFLERKMIKSGLRISGSLLSAIQRRNAVVRNSSRTIWSGRFINLIRQSFSSPHVLCRFLSRYPYHIMKSIVRPISRDQMVGCEVKSRRESSKTSMSTSATYHGQSFSHFNVLLWIPPNGPDSGFSVGTSNRHTGNIGWSKSSLGPQ